MKTRFEIGEIVKIKATGEKVKIVGYFECDKCGIDMSVPYPYKTNSKESTWYSESELKPYRPSRTGKYRNEKGQFISKTEVNHVCSWCDGVFLDIGKHLMNCSYRKAAQEQREHFSYEDVSDSKQRNYQKILTTLDRIEKKIDELGIKI